MKEQKSVPVLERARRRNIKVAEVFDRIRYFGLGALVGSVIESKTALVIASLSVAFAAGGVSDISKKFAEKKLKRIDNINNRRSLDKAPETVPEIRGNN